MKKVSFDFDSTLSRKDIQEYAKELINKGFEVWICTSRLSPKDAPNTEWNDDLFLVADEVGVKRENIIFTNYEDKYVYLKNKDFVWHIDDDNIELSMIKSYTDVVPIYLFANKNWKEDCEKTLNV